MRNVTTQSTEFTNNKISCHQCDLFDFNTNKCGVFKIDTASKVTKCHLYTQSTLLEELDCMMDKEHSYPFVPAFTPEIDGLIWDVSPENTFGCWILNNYKKKFFIATHTTTMENIQTGVYKSLTPLHKHESSDSIKSHLTWYVNEDGVGCYVLINKYNEILYLK